MQSRGGPVDYPRGAHLLSLIGGILILIDAIVVLIAFAVLGTALASFGLGAFGAIIIALAGIGVVFALLIIFGALRIKSQPTSAHTWGIVIILLALISFLGGGGFYIGSILALIGGILAVVWKPTAPTPGQPYGQPYGQPGMGAPGPGMPPPPPPSMTPMAGAGGVTCAYCGTAIPAGSKFCPKCGAAVPGA